MPYSLSDLIKLWTVNVTIERKFIERDFYVMSLNPAKGYRTIFKGVGFLISDDPVAKTFGIDKMAVIEVWDGAYSCSEYPIKNLCIKNKRQGFTLPELIVKNDVRDCFAIVDCSQSMRFLDKKDNECYQTLVICYDGELYHVEHGRGIEKGFASAKHTRVTNVKDLSFIDDLRTHFAEYPNFAREIENLNFYSGGEPMKLKKARAIMQLALML